MDEASTTPKQIPHELATKNQIAITQTLPIILGRSRILFLRFLFLLALGLPLALDMAVHRRHEFKKRFHRMTLPTRTPSSSATKIQISSAMAQCMWRTLLHVAWRSQARYPQEVGFTKI